METLLNARLTKNSVPIGASILASPAGCADDPQSPLRLQPAPESTWTLLATGEQFVDVWGSSGSEVFALGAAGTVLRYDGSSWANFPAPSSSWGAI